jgi:hypothetical protein
VRTRIGVVAERERGEVTYPSVAGLREQNELRQEQGKPPRVLLPLELAQWDTQEHHRAKSTAIPPRTRAAFSCLTRSEGSVRARG